MSALETHEITGRASVHSDSVARPLSCLRCKPALPSDGDRHKPFTAGRPPSFDRVVPYKEVEWAGSPDGGG
jgi:hypothetical protein